MYVLCLRVRPSTERGIKFEDMMLASPRDATGGNAMTVIAETELQGVEAAFV